MSMRAFEAVLNRDNLHRIVLQERPEEVYVFAFADPDDSICIADHLQDDVAMAKRCSAEQYGTTAEIWHEIPDTGLMAWDP
jgi:hypothetical protein